MGSEISSVRRHHGGEDGRSPLHPSSPYRGNLSFSPIESSVQQQTLLQGGATQLQTIEIPSGEFFPMWRAHMDSHLGSADMEISAYSVWEFALCDCRLQYVELLKLDGAVEVEFVSFDEEDTFLASPCDGTVEQVTWKVNNLGWIKVPASLDDSAHKIALSNEWWIGLRNTFSASIKSSMQYRLFADRLFRLFIVPIACEDYMRVIITTNMPSVLHLLSDPTKHSSVGARFLAHCLLSKPAGEFLATVQDVSDGTQDESETEVFEFLAAAEDVESSSAQAKSASAVTRRLIFCRSDSLKAEPSGSDAPMLPSANVEDSQAYCSNVMETEDHSVHKSVPLHDGAGSGVDDKPTAPPLSEIEPQQPYVHVPTAPSAPPLSDMDSPKSKPRYTEAGIELKPTAPPLPKFEAVQQNVRALPLAPPLSGGTCAPQSKPLPLLVRQSSTHHPDLALGSHLFPHQKRTVQWMMDVEAERVPPLFVPQATLFGEWYVYRHGFKKTMFHKTVDVIVPHNHQLALGGLVAHPVGAGKTIIAAELIKQTLGQGVNLVLVPGHIVKQWKKELERFVPGIQVDTPKVSRSKPVLHHLVGHHADVVLLPHSAAIAFAKRGEESKAIYRIIIDEPQEIVSKPELFDPLLQVNCRYRWLLTATPTPLQSVMQLALGYIESQCSLLAYESMLSWFTRTRARRDPPHLCLPVPPLHVHMKPVALLWQETSVMHSYVLRDDLQAAVRLSSFFFAHGQIRKDTAKNALKGAKAYQSLNEWVESHHAILSAQLVEQQVALESVKKRILKEKASYEIEKQSGGYVHIPEGASTANPGIEEDINIENIFDEDEPGVSLGLLRSRGTYHQNIANLERRLVFLSTISDTVTSDSECLICMNLIGGRVVSMLPCLHSFCAICAAKLFERHNQTSCPVCRNNTHRREVCTFVCAEQVALTASRKYGELREKFGSKICAVIQQVAQILTDFPDDKLLVFGQWHDLLRQLSSAMPKHIRHVFLDGALSQRCEQIEDFRNKPSLRVMLLSSESQASGANLEVANHVVIIHPYCPANVSKVSTVPLAQAQTFEQQAIGRVLRFPQTKDVHVYRFYSLGTPEEELYAHWGWAGLSQTQQVC